MKHSIEEVEVMLRIAENEFECKSKEFQSEEYKKLIQEGIVSPPYNFGWWMGYLDGIRWLLHHRPRKKELIEKYWHHRPNFEAHTKNDDWKTMKLKNIGYKEGYGHALKWDISAYVTPL